jgi:hypothetical protein
MLPRVEVDNLITAIFEAVDLAAECRITVGYQVLLMGGRHGLHCEPIKQAIAHLALK